jgi:23S rRNA pseudouridine1911/1915/1917 synthase
MTPRDLKAMALSQLQLSEGEWVRILWHGGLYAGGKRLGSEELPGTFQAGTTLDLYYFVREPQSIQVSEQSILERGKGWLAANKPPWLPVQGSRVSLRFGFEEALRLLPGCQTLSAVHRLDRETSGVVLFAFEKATEAWMMRQFHDQKVVKTYLAIVSPPPEKSAWKVEGYLVRDFHRLPQDFYRLRADAKSKGRWSEREFEVMKVDGGKALVLARPKTGRTHQIRVHLSDGGSPIVGDRIYGKKNSEADRMQLHAYQIEFDLPEGRILQRKKISAPVPMDFLIYPDGTL